MTETKTFRRIGVAEAEALLAQGGAIVYDVRDLNSYRAGHIDEARHLSGETLGDVITATPKSAPILICCYHGNSSQEYARILTDFGFSDVYSLDGGFLAWANRRPR